MDRFKKTVPGYTFCLFAFLSYYKAALLLGDVVAQTKLFYIWCPIHINYVHRNYLYIFKGTSYRIASLKPNIILSAFFVKKPCSDFALK